MKIDILTLFPNMFDGFVSESIIKRAIDKKIVDINIIDLRKYSTHKHGQVDDTPYGGGAGMVLMVDVVYNALNDLRTSDSVVIMMTPDGEVFNQRKAYEYKNFKHIILLCGHYEGFDDRIRLLVDIELSVGDYILTGGEIPSMIVSDSVIRLLDGVITDESSKNESFNNNLLDYPVYTKPREFMGEEVPSVLLSGNHQEIAKWRYEAALKKTKERRPDLLVGDGVNEK